MDFRSIYRIAKSDPTGTWRGTVDHSQEGGFALVVQRNDPTPGCVCCFGHGMVAVADAENGPEFDSIDFCSCPAGEERSQMTNDQVIERYALRSWMGA